MSFSYTHIDNPTGTGPFTFVPTYSDAAEIAVQGYNGKHWSNLAVSSVDAQTVNISGLT